MRVIKQFIVAAVSLILIGGCSVASDEELTPMEQAIESGARLLIVNAHPDDEILMGALLSQACIEKDNQCRFALLTRGEGGGCDLESGCPEGLGVVREGEMNQVAKAYGAELVWAGLKNYPMRRPDSGENPSEADHADELGAIRRGWEETLDPVEWIRGQVESFKPDLILTLDPDHGFYGHPEHRLAGMLVLEAMGVGDDTSAPLQHTPSAVYNVLNRYTLLRPMIGLDPNKETETWSVDQPCGEVSCMKKAMEYSQFHQSQLSSGVDRFNFIGKFINLIYLRRIEIE